MRDKSHRPRDARAPANSTAAAAHSPGLRTVRAPRALAHTARRSGARWRGRGSWCRDEVSLQPLCLLILGPEKPHHIAAARSGTRISPRLAGSPAGRQPEMLHMAIRTIEVDRLAVVRRHVKLDGQREQAAAGAALQPLVIVVSGHRLCAPELLSKGHAALA